MRELTSLAKSTGVKESDIIHAARGVARALIKDCDGDFEKAVELMRGTDAGEVAEAILESYVREQRALAIRALTRSEEFAEMIAYKLVDRASGHH